MYTDTLNEARLILERKYNTRMVGISGKASIDIIISILRNNDVDVDNMYVEQILSNFVKLSGGPVENTGNQYNRKKRLVDKKVKNKVLAKKYASVRSVLKVLDINEDPYTLNHKKLYWHILNELEKCGIFFDEKPSDDEAIKTFFNTFKRVLKKKKCANNPKDFYISREWRRVRMKAFEIYGNKCQCCGRSHKDGIVLHVDHIKPRSIYPELELDVNNLQILCEDCNLGKSYLYETDYR